jgi:4-alpha-glucanotransferase
MERASGILLHPTSLPGRFGIGEFNDDAYRFIDYLAEAGQKIWQVLPLGPTGFGDSPYQCFSAFAGNPLLISLDHLVREGALSPGDLKDAPDLPADAVDYGSVIDFKFDILHKSYVHFMQYATPAQQEAFQKFCADNANWLDDYALFMGLKDAHDGNVWNTWQDDITRRTPTALSRWRNKLQTQTQTYKYYQYQFFQQWNALKTYANDKGIKIIGDVPIFVAYDSADAWAHRDLFYFDERGNSTVVAGVPPDYFSPTGQRWGNPLYRWDVMAKDGYAWWIERCRAAFAMYDYVRIDHFRGFEAYWEVPANAPTAINGKWVKGPGKALFQAIERELLPSPPVPVAKGEGRSLPIIAEDLGVITPEVEALRDSLGFPGMRVLQFAFVADTSSDFLPHNYVRNTVAYAGTHDNDTTVGWYQKLDDKVRRQVLDYTGTDGSQINWDLIRLLMMSVANTVVLTLQDVLGLGDEARMNFPGRGDGNWTWRFTWDMLTDEVKSRLKHMAATYGR